MELNAVILVAGAGLVSLAIRAALQSRRTGTWKARAEASGLTDVVQDDGFGSSDVSGNRGRHQVRIERYSRGKNARGSRVVVRGLATDIILQREDLASRIGKAFGGGEVRLGDPQFDEEIYVRGPEAMLRALLDVKTRELLHDAFRRLVRTDGGVVRSIDSSLAIESGELKMEFEDGFQASDEPQVDTLQAMLALGERLAPIECLEPRLAHNARHDPLPAVRSRALAALAGGFPGADETRAAMRDALQDEQPEIRLQAALWLKDEGRATLESLASSIEVPDECSAAAVDGLRAPGPALRSILDEAMRTERPRTAEAALMALAREGDAHVEALAQALRDPREELATSAARALGATGSPRAEEPLLTALEQAPDGVREAAAMALGFVGCARSVMALQEFERDGRRGAGQIVREAVARIQERLTGASPGQLALAGDDEGRVALADDAGGRVGLPEPPEQEP